MVRNEQIGILAEKEPVYNWFAVLKTDVPDADAVVSAVVAAVAHTDEYDTGNDAVVFAAVVDEDVAVPSRLRHDLPLMLPKPAKIMSSSSPFLYDHNVVVAVAVVVAVVASVAVSAAVPVVFAVDVPVFFDVAHISPPHPLLTRVSLEMLLRTSF